MLLLLPVLLLLPRAFKLYLTLQIGLLYYLHLQTRVDAPSYLTSTKGHVFKSILAPLRPHQLFRPHVVQDPLGVLTVMAALHDGE